MYMNDNYMEAMDSIRNDEYQGDREREREKEEDRFEEMTIMEKMDHIMKEAQELDEKIDEKQAKFYWDAKYGMIWRPSNVYQLPNMGMSR